MTQGGESRRTVTRGTLFNLMGLGLPMLVAVAATPPLIHALGAARYGVLTVAWGLIGYFTLLDLGLGRAVTKGVAERVGTSREAELPGFIWTSVHLLTLMGVVGALLALPVGLWAVEGGLRIPAAFRGEARDALVLLALSLPFVIGTTGLRCVLEGYNQFGAINAIRLPMGVFTFAGPLLVLPFSHALGPVVGILVAGRVVGWAAHLGVCLARVPRMRESLAPSRAYLGELLRFGGWMTAVMVSGMLMSYLDRFFIGAMISMAAVTYFATPFDMLQRITMLSGALVGALFPVVAAGLASSGSEDEADRAALVFGWSLRSLFLALIPMVLVLVTLAREGLDLWLGHDFSVHGAGVVQWVAVGVLLNSVGAVGAAGVQGAGRPDLTGKLNLLELPLYLGLLWWLLRTRGIEGAAMAYTLRVAVDTAAILFLACRTVPAVTPGVRLAAWTLVGAIVTCVAGALLPSTGTRLLFLAVTLPLFAGVGWRTLLLPEERRALLRMARVAGGWRASDLRA